MAWLTDTIDTIAGLPRPLMLGGAALFALVESGLGVGMVVPGETAVLVLGASLGVSPGLAALFVVVAVASSAGDHIGFFLGRRLGPGLRDTRLIDRVGIEHWDRAVGTMRRNGARAVFFTRLLPIVRTLTPAAAGTAGVRYRSFLAASVTGAALWSALYTGAGALAGESIRQVESYLGRAAWVLFAVLAMALLVVLLLRRRAAVGE